MVILTKMLIYNRNDVFKSYQSNVYYLYCRTLSNNPIETIYPNAFKSVSVGFLLMSSMLFTELPSHVFNTFSAYYVDLSGGQLQTIQKGAFNDTRISRGL